MPLNVLLLLNNSHLTLTKCTFAHNNNKKYFSFTISNVNIKLQSTNIQSSQKWAFIDKIYQKFFDNNDNHENVKIINFSIVTIFLRLLKLKSNEREKKY